MKFNFPKKPKYSVLNSRARQKKEHKQNIHIIEKV